jgi:hypothetical protein
MATEEGKTMKPLYGITRIDHEGSRTHAWRVAIQRRGMIYSAHFSDGVCGGKAKALAAAKKWRNDVLATEAPMARADYCNIRRRNNRSGIPGVSYHEEIVATKIGEATRRFWIARCPKDPWHTKLAKFSVSKYGMRGAKKLAVEARKAALAQMAGQSFDPGAARAA